MRSEQMVDAYREQNPDHEEEFKNIHYKTTINSRRKLMTLPKEPDLAGNGDCYRVILQIRKRYSVSRACNMLILLCILKFHPATPVIAMDKLLRMEPLGAYKPEVFEEWIPSVHQRRELLNQLGIMTGIH